jgi:hypothetical protein
MSTRSTLRYTLGALALVAAAAAFPAASHAVVFNLDSDHCSDGCGPAGTIFGSVALTQNGTTVDVVVDLFNSFQFAKTGSVDFQAFKFNATGVVVDDISSE